MSYEGAKPLLTLAHPLILIINPAKEVEQVEKHICLQFPEVDLNWEGFTVPHLHWVGINVGNRELWQMQIALRHEFNGHKALGNSPHIRFMKYQMMDVYGCICIVFEERAERVRVPLTVDQSSNGGKELQARLRYIGSSLERSSLVEEVYSIHTSLYSVLKEKKIEKLDYLKLRSNYINTYEKHFSSLYYPHSSKHYFSEIYKAYERIAGKIGDVAAAAMVDVCFVTSNPLIAFLDFLNRLSDEATDCLPKLSYEEAFYCCHKFLDLLSPDDSRYERKLTSAALARREQSVFKHIEIIDDFFKFWLSLPEDRILFTVYTNFIHPFSETKPCIQGVNASGRFVIVTEAIRQQLTQGIGLLCPFWPHSAPYCCNSDCRSLLEKVWSCTEPTSSCRHWKRMGCLM